MTYFAFQLIGLSGTGKSTYWLNNDNRASIFHNDTASGCQIPYLTLPINEALSAQQISAQFLRCVAELFPGEQAGSEAASG